ncbi:hypothetical protein DFH27DRAFT_236587 [Peziza echinospora]|nr:hypothetical protein DFH27DRAFT_236587 [Peziza echinospora]
MYGARRRSAAPSAGMLCLALHRTASRPPATRPSQLIGLETTSPYHHSISIFGNPSCLRDNFHTAAAIYAAITIYYLIIATIQSIPLPLLLPPPPPPKRACLLALLLLHCNPAPPPPKETWRLLKSLIAQETKKKRPTYLPT